MTEGCIFTLEKFCCNINKNIPFIDDFILVPCEVLNIILYISYYICWKLGYVNFKFGLKNKYLLNKFKFLYSAWFNKTIYMQIYYFCTIVIYIILIIDGRFYISFSFKICVF